MKKVVIAAAKRTAIGSFQGQLSPLSAPELGSQVIKSILSDNQIDASNVDEVIMGNVLSAGLGQAPARQTALGAGMPESTECLTINKMCGSGLKAVMLADQAIKCGDANMIIAGGIESMSNAPYILPKARTGYRLGHDKILDTMILDGLWDKYNNIHMGNCAENCAKNFKMSREEVDNFAIESYERAIKATSDGKFTDEIIDLKITSRKGEVIINIDEEPTRVMFEKIKTLNPAFDSDGIITAANASKINDGAAALLVCSEEKANEMGLKPLVEIIGQSSAAKAPIDFTIAPADAINKVLLKTNMNVSDIDLYEINEAFAVVSIAVNKLLGLKTDNVNVNGGAIALGHPIGASGARILVTLIHELKRRSLEYGLASLCIGGGEASAIIVKNLI